MQRIEITDVNLYDIFNHASVWFTNNGMLDEQARINMVDLMVYACSKYIGCNYIGKWDSEDDCYKYIENLLGSKLAQNLTYILTLFKSDNFILSPIPTSRTEKIIKNAQNDTLTLGENAPITSPTNIPDIKSGVSGIDTPNTKNRGRYVGNEDNTHTIESPDYMERVINLLKRYPSVADVAIMIFEPFVDEYMKWW